MRKIISRLRLSLILFALLLTVSGLFLTSDTTSALPLPPVLDYPWNGMNVGGTVIPFRWDAVYGAYDYYL